MNVMAQAHKNTKLFFEVQPLSSFKYVQVFRDYLRAAHREHKAMNATTSKTVKVVLANVSTHELVEGDEIMHYGVVLKLKNRKEWPMRSGDCPNMQGVCVTFDTDLIWHPDFNMSKGDEPYYGFPLERAKNFNVQGNKMAVWSKITRREEF